MFDKIQPNLSASYTREAHRVEAGQGILLEKAHHVSAEVKLSNEALALQRIVKSVTETPDVRADLVRDIQAQIEAGIYQVDANALAEKLLPLLR